MDNENIDINQNDERTITACKVCGRIMINASKEICAECLRSEEFIFLKAKNFLRMNPGATISQICKHINTTPDVINRFIVTGKFNRAGFTRVAHECRLCRKTIYEGIMCEECEQELRSQLSNLRNLNQ